MRLVMNIFAFGLLCSALFYQEAGAFTESPWRTSKESASALDVLDHRPVFLHGEVGRTLDPRRAACPSTGVRGHRHLRSFGPVYFHTQFNYTF